MDSESVKVDLHVIVWPKASSSGRFLNSVVINIDRAFEEFLIHENDDNITSLGSYPDPTSHPDSLILMTFPNFEPNSVYQLLQDKLHDHVLSTQICNQIVDKAQQQRRRQGSNFPLSVLVSVKLTQKVYNVVPCNAFPNENREEEETCSICLENLLVFGPEEDKRSICQMPNCSHLFHEDCIIEWLNRFNNSCPLCRQPVYEQPQ